MGRGPGATRIVVKKPLKVTESMKFMLLLLALLVLVPVLGHCEQGIYRDRDGGYAGSTDRNPGDSSKTMLWSGQPTQTGPVANSLEC
jgi:hypothetical protein